MTHSILSHLEQFVIPDYSARLTAEEIIQSLNLQPHPEGGYYRETYRDEGVIPKAALPERYAGDCSYSTAIYYLLTQGSVSTLHKIASDEVWHHYQGGSLTIVMFDPNAKSVGNSADAVGKTVILGDNLMAGQTPQVVEPAGWWFGAYPNANFALAGCTVAPGFDFKDFKLADRAVMIKQYANEADQVLIRKLLPES